MATDDLQAGGRSDLVIRLMRYRARMVALNRGYDVAVLDRAIADAVAAEELRGRRAD